jgi:hypothetical protein
MASHNCPFCQEEFGCRHLIGEGDDQIQWFWPVIGELKELSEDAGLMKIDIGKLAKGVRGFEELTPDTQSWWEDFVPDVIVGAKGIHLEADRYDFGGPASGTWYGVFVDPKEERKIEAEYEELVERLRAVTAARGMVS